MAEKKNACRAEDVSLVQTKSADHPKNPYEGLHITESLKQWWRE